MPRGEIIEQKTDAYIDGVWYTIARNQMTYNTTGKRITSENLASQITTTARDQLACTLVGELVAASKLGGSQSSATEYAYSYDDIGNRLTSLDLVTNRVYSANELNRYSSITTLTSDVGLQTSGFEPQFDDDGNQTVTLNETLTLNSICGGERK